MQTRDLDSGGVKTDWASIRKAARHDMTVGGLWFFGGIIVTAGTYMAAANGGTYIIAWGAILWGGIRFFRGLSRRNG